MKKITFIILLLAIVSPAFAGWNPVNFEVKPVELAEGGNVLEKKSIQKGSGDIFHLEFTFDSVSGIEETINWQVGSKNGTTVAVEPTGTYTENYIDISNDDCGWKEITATFGNLVAKSKIVVVEILLPINDPDSEPGPIADFPSNKNLVETDCGWTIIYADYCPLGLPPAEGEEPTVGPLNAFGNDLELKWEIINNTSVVYFKDGETIADDQTPITTKGQFSISLGSLFPGTATIKVTDLSTGYSATQQVTFWGVTELKVYEEGDAINNTITISPSDLGATPEMILYNSDEDSDVSKFVLSGFDNFPANQATAQKILWEVLKDGLPYEDGSYDSLPADRIIETNYEHTYTINVGNNIDGVNGLDPCEIQMTVIVNNTLTIPGVVKSGRSAATINGDRPSETPYTIKAGEHQEVGSNFDFLIDGINHSDLKYCLYDATSYTWDGTELPPANKTLASGGGSSFSHTWLATMLGSSQVIFYIDKGGSFSDNPVIASEKFNVVNMRTINLPSIRWSDALGANFGVTIPTLLLESRNMLLKRDSNNDFRACVSFNYSYITTPIISTDTNINSEYKDPLNNFEEDISTWHSLNGFVLIDTLVGEEARQRPIGEFSTIIGGGSSHTTKTQVIARYIGFFLGIGKNNKGDEYLLRNGSVSLNSSWLTEAESKLYDLGP